jgi:hypothetical protein
MVFSLSAAKEYQRKSFTGFGNAAASVALINQCIKHTQTIAETSGLEVLWFDESQQQGHTFAERFKNAISSCFEQGYERVISIGNDSPDLTTDTLSFAAEKLLTNDIVIGPAQDGGVYLFGLNKDVFDADEFATLPWQQNTLQEAILANAAQKEQKITCLSQLIDLDDIESIKTYVCQHPNTKISRLFARFAAITNDAAPLLPYTIVLPSVHIAINPFRGPPVAFV